MKRNLLLLLIALLALNCSIAEGMDIYVSPAGSDSQSGQADQPLKSLAAAQQKAREFAGKEAVTIHVADGIYYLPETLVLGPQDSGTQQHPVIYKAVNENGAILSGGSKLDLTWAADKDGVFKAKTPAGLKVDQLFINGKNQRMARYPNYDANKKAEPYQGFAADAFSKERAAGWADPTGGYIHALHRSQWGGYHYHITGKKANGDVSYEGGWQNNRKMGMHKDFRMVENIFEELDAPGEWFHNANSNTLFYKPAAGVDLDSAVVEVVRLRHLVEFQGSESTPVKHIRFQGFVVRHAARTFMDTKEQMVRSDWAIYRGGSFLLTGTEDVQILDCEFDQVGGNAVFVNNYNRRTLVKGCHIHDPGASGVCFIGDPNAARDPLFEYREKNDLEKMDRTVGPKTNNYPSLGVVEDCLIHGVGRTERQPAGVTMDMAMKITVRDTSVYDCARSGINIGDGAWGGHLIERCDVFDTVLETHDHGSFNSWGRDRFWHSDRSESQRVIDKDPNLPFLDAMHTTTIRNSRWRCDHGWDIDLDDGSTNYEIYNNLMLGSGLKLREGFRRRAWNNITVHGGLHPHVWYDRSGDEVHHNIFTLPHKPARMSRPYNDQVKVDENFFNNDKAAVMKVSATMAWDENSSFGDPMFVDPANGDFRVKEGSPALKMGFKNFPMDQFGVKKPSLKAIARTPDLSAPKKEARKPKKAAPPRIAKWMGATLADLTGEEFSAYGVSKQEAGVVLSDVPKGSKALDAGLQQGDVIQGLNGQSVSKLRHFNQVLKRLETETIKLKVVRNQQVIELVTPLDKKLSFEAATKKQPARGKQKTKRGKPARLRDVGGAVAPINSTPNSVAAKSSAANDAGGNAKRPNIVFVMSDDQRWDTFGCYGRTDVRTPTIDHLSAKGVTFDNAFYAVAICMSSRATMFTGRYFSDHKSGFTYPFNRPLPANEFADSYPAQLRAAGYRTGFVGKFGVRLEDLPNTVADHFDYYTGISTTSKKGPHFPDDEKLQHIYRKDRNPKERTLIKGDSMIHFLDTQPKGKPFCLSVSFDAVKNDRDSDMYGPHEELFEGQQMWVPENYVVGDNDKLPKVLKDNARGVYLHRQRTSTPEEYQRRTRRFAVQGYTVDQQVKRLMDKLKEMGELENTVVIYTSDNGRFHGSQGLFDKCILYDEAMKQPLIVFDPRAPKSRVGTRVDAMVSSTDIAPTILSLAGLNPPNRMKGRDLSNLLAGTQDLSKWRDTVLMENFFIQEMLQGKKKRKDVTPEELNKEIVANNRSYRTRGVRTKRYKYFIYYEHNPVIEELYDLELDPYEQNNLVSSPDYTKVLEKLRAKTNELQTKHSQESTEDARKKTSGGRLKIYYIRHAEGGHNVKKAWQKKGVPKSEWPAYVGNPNMFTPLGLEQLAAVPAKLKKYKFDFIASSQMWRCRNTILPYMKEVGAKGEVWPELCEQPASSRILKKDLPKPTVPVLGAGRRVKLPEDELEHFSLREDGMNFFTINRGDKGPGAADRSAAAARLIIQDVLDRVQTRFGGTNKSILFSGHGSSGMAVLRMLTQDPLDGIGGIKNTGIWMVQQQEDGSYKLMMYNDKPYKHQPEAKADKATQSISQIDATYTKLKGLPKDPNGFVRRDNSDIIKVGDLYYVWYSKMNQQLQPVPSTIWYATSPDGYTWTEQGECITPGAQGSWDCRVVYTPGILVAKEKYYLFYTAQGNDQADETPNGNRTAIGICVAESPAGPWTKSKANPILRTSDNHDDFDSHRIDDSCLITRNGKYWMYFKGRQWGKGPTETKMGVAIADLPEGPYVKHKSNPLAAGGHEVLVWSEGEGVGVLIGMKLGANKAVPFSISYAQDGINFVKTAEIENQKAPWAGGGYRPRAFTDSNEGQRVKWGLHIGGTRPDLFLERFDLKADRENQSLVK